MSNKQSKKTILFKVAKYAAVFFVYLPLLLGALCLARFFIKESPTQEELPPEAFYPADYSVNILDNHAYLSLDHSVYYMNYGTGEPLTAENNQKVGIASAFFYEYFDSIIGGDAAAYRSMLTDTYIDEFDPPEKFTMQMLYDIQVNQSHSASTTTYNGETVNVYHFTVSYKIFENNGTFRRDIASNQSVTQYYDLIYHKNKMLLNNISNSIVVSTEEVSDIRRLQTTVDLCVIGIFVLIPVIWVFLRRRVKRKQTESDEKTVEKR